MGYKSDIFGKIWDVRNQTFEKLCEDFKQPPFNLDVRQYLTMPSLANEFFRKTVYIPNKYKLFLKHIFLF